MNIRFLDGETVSIRVGDQTQRFNFIQMGMGDRRSGRPTKQWELLRIFANEHGSLTWNSGDASRRNQKRREILARNLQAVFGLVDDPFTFKEGGWTARFTIEPEH